MLQLRPLLPGPGGTTASEGAPPALVDAADAYAYPDGDAPYLRVNMVSSADGAASLGGRVGALTGPADQQLLRLLRAMSDVLLVGAGTVRAEGYGPVRVSAEWQDRRTAAGRAPYPRLAVLTRGLTVDLDSPAFTEAPVRPLLITTEQAPTERVRDAAAVADVVVAGGRTVDLGTAVQALTERGLTRILSEGGPHVLGELYAEDLVDELCLAVAPMVTCGEELRITAGPALPSPTPLRLAHVLEQDDFLFLRYTRRGPEER